MFHKMKYTPEEGVIMLKSQESKTIVLNRNNKTSYKKTCPYALMSKTDVFV